LNRDAKDLFLREESIELEEQLGKSEKSETSSKAARCQRGIRGV
jgi:hypothetical protein